MKRKILGIIVMMLLIATSLQVVGTTNDNKISRQVSSDYDNLIQQIIDIGYIMNGWTEEDKLFALDGEANDWFGISVSISGNYAIIGAPFDNDNGDNSGSAYVFKRDNSSWTEEQKLTASDGEINDYFGRSVSISDDYVLVGTPYDDDNGDSSGSAYIFKRTGTTWDEQDKLIATDGGPIDQFGFYVSISGDYAIIGADRDNSMTGSVYIFKRNGTSWIEEQKLTAPDGEEHDRFGWSVSIDGDYVIIGAPGDDSSTGSAYVFKHNGTSWTEEQKLTASDGETLDHFGSSVSIDGNSAIVGANWDDDNGDYSGSAYVFKRDNSSWTEEQKLTASDGEINDYFGGSSSISGDYAIIGKYPEHSYDSAYVFKRNVTTWYEQDKLIGSGGEEYDEFGWSVSIDGDYVIIGAPGDDSSTGSAYVFVKNGGIPEIVVDEIRGGFRVSANIKNIGNETASNVEWSTDLTGGIIFLGRHTEGVITSLAPDETKTVRQPILFGIGKDVIITVIADGSSKQTTAKWVLGPLVLGVT